MVVDRGTYRGPGAQTVSACQCTTAPVHHSVPVTPQRARRWQANILNFNVGDSVALDLPPVFFTRLRNVFGVKKFVSEQGEDRAIEGAVDSIVSCLRQVRITLLPGMPVAAGSRTKHFVALGSRPNKTTGRRLLRRARGVQSHRLEQTLLLRGGTTRSELFGTPRRAWPVRAFLAGRPRAWCGWKGKLITERREGERAQAANT